MKILGHPVHVMLIHFPSALFPMDVVCASIALYTGNDSFRDAAFYALAGGVAFGWLAVITGTFDLIGVAENHAPVLKKALVHGGINTVVVIGYTVIGWRMYQTFPDLSDTLPLLLTRAGLVIFMIAGNYVGGSLVLKYGVGLEENKTT